MFCNKICLSLVVLILAAAPCSAAGNSGDNQTMPWYSITCFSLKQGSVMRNARFRLHDNGRFEFIIQGETLRGTTGSYQYDGLRFSAAVDFSLGRGKPYRYVLSFTGMRVLEAYAGFARLREYIEETKLTQEVFFLFIASRESENKPERRIPFL